ncbi:MAG: Lrp/AsnC ligand binding domain-containing protein [Candidatus Bathyarchaeia archaeon]
MLAFVFVRVNVDAVSKVASEISEINSVKEVYEVTGDIDIIVKVSAQNVDELSRIVFKIREIEGVQGTDTRIVLVSHTTG